MSTNQLLPVQDLTLNCRLASRFSTVDSSNRQMLPNRVSARLCITASREIAPDRMYTAGSATVCGKDRICFRISYIVFLFSILFYPITLEGRRGTTDEFATIPFHLDLFSAALVELAKSIPVHSLILSSHLFFCLPLFLFPFTVPCRIVFAKPEDLETWPNHLSFRFLTRVRSSSYSPMAAWIFLRTSSLVTWSLYEMFNSLR